MTRALVIGDVHGCAQELDELLAACDRGQDDRVVLVGDLVAKGPDSAGVIRRVRALGAEAVLGNHDARVVQCWRALERGESPPRPDGEHAQLARALDPADLAWLAERPLWLALPEHAALVVHAGLVPGVPLEAQDPRMLLTIRTLAPDGAGSSAHDAGVLWGVRYTGPPLVLFGHHARRGLQRHPWAIGLDTGCVYGGELTACVLPERKLVSVRAGRAYQAAGGTVW